jgi:hypothetical protein
LINNLTTNIFKEFLTGLLELILLLHPGSIRILILQLLVEFRIVFPEFADPIFHGCVIKIKGKNQSRGKEQALRPKPYFPIP